MAEPVAELWEYEEAAPELSPDVLADTGTTRVLIEREAPATAEPLPTELALPPLAPAPTAPVNYLDFPMPDMNAAGERTA
ncbi:MAG TPA: hypothetical protein VLI05_05080 [Candidatus Saccharimonadia bacterium]|nr:hypothetical protein [Candidatus Saccharimonadia bacterium]